MLFVVMLLLFWDGKSQRLFAGEGVVFGEKALDRGELMRSRAQM